jgi:group I intron endonuclease
MTDGLPANTNAQCGVYMIRNTRNGKKYIGSTKNAKQRESAHFRGLLAGSHSCAHLQNAWNAEEDKSVFRFGMFIYCRADLRVELEQACLDLMRPEYNVSPRADMPTPFEYWSKEKQQAQRELARALFSGANNPSCNMSGAQLSERASRGVTTRRARGTDIVGTQKAIQTRLEKGLNPVIGRKVADARILNGTERLRIEKGTATRKANGSFITGAEKAAKTRKEKGIDNQSARKAAKTRKINGTDFFTESNPSLTLTVGELKARAKKSNDTKAATGTHKTAGQKTVKTRRANNTYSEPAKRGAATALARGTHNSQTMTPQQFAIRGRRISDAMRWKKLKKLLTNHIYFGA